MIRREQSGADDSENMASSQGPSGDGNGFSSEREYVVAQMFSVFPIPMVVVDGRGRIIDCNPSAETFWGVSKREIVKTPALSVLGLARIDGPTIVPWASWEDLQAQLQTGERILCRVTGRDGRLHVGALVGTGLTYRGRRYTFLGVVQEQTANILEVPPDWALTDPVTGLGNRVFWERHQEVWNGQAGTVVLMDVDDLKTVNDLYGHGEGDRLLGIVGRTLRDVAPPDALVLRYGGDEFVGWCPVPDPQWGVEWGQKVNERLEVQSQQNRLPIVPHISYGVAVYRPGHLAEALKQADDAMYEQKGTLLRSRHGGRLIISRSRRLDVEVPGDSGALIPGYFAGQFGLEFDAAFRAQHTRANEEARAFVEFLQPEPGTAVLEVGAGTGRIAFDGGLAERVGSEGVVLLTDPSRVQLYQARQRAEQLGYSWVRFLEAPAESLPVASSGADLVLGAWFLHLCHAEQAVREMARVTRPGGRVGLDVFLAFALSPAWLEMLMPLRKALTDAGLPFRVPGCRPGEAAQLCETAGLVVEGEQMSRPNVWTFPSWSLAWSALEQGGHLQLVSQGLSEPVRTVAFSQVKERMAEVFSHTTLPERSLTVQAQYVVARRP